MSSSLNETDRRSFLKTMMAAAVAAFGVGTAAAGTAEAGNAAATTPAGAGLSFKATEKFREAFGISGNGDAEYTALVLDVARQNLPMGQRYYGQVCGLDDRDLNKAWLHFYPRV